MVLAVDFPDFLQAPLALPTGESSGDRWHNWVTETLEATLSLAAITDSVKTLALQADPDAPTLTQQGHNPLSEYRAITARRGYHPLFVQKLLAYEHVLRTRPSAALTLASSESLRSLAAIIEHARSVSLPLVLVLPPYHASYLDLIDVTGRRDEFNAWKDAVTAEANAGSARLIDFSLPHSFTNEAIPKQSDYATVPRYYWESGHFKTALVSRL